MDRLICGDVGYGKTEVALRAAFKAANAGKQVLCSCRRRSSPSSTTAPSPSGSGLPVHDRARLALPPAGRAARGGQAPSPRARSTSSIGTHRLLSRDVRAQGPRPDHRRRGAALRRQAEGAAAPAQAEGRRDLDERDADPAHAADVARRPARHLRDRDAAGGPPAGQDLRRRVRRGARQAGAEREQRARRPGVLPPQPRRDIDETAERLRGAVPGAALRRRARPDRREASSRSG